MTHSSLQEFLESVSADNHLRVEDDLGGGFVRLRAAEAQRRQAQQDIRQFEDVVIEMLRNSRDAQASALFVATWKDATKRYLTIIDDGVGIPAEHHQTIFEPFVTSKLDTFHHDRWGVHGRGMALYSIKENCALAEVLLSESGKGSVFHVESELSCLTEKKDQSTYPRIVTDDQGSKVLRGPHNIIRTVMEFAIDERKDITVYFGGAVDIAATLYELGVQALIRKSTLLQEEKETLPYLFWLGTCSNPGEFAHVAHQLGLPLSDRSARRIIDGTISGLPPIIESLVLPSKKTSSSKSKKPFSFSFDKPASLIRFSENELADIKESVKKPFSDLADSYYLNKDVEPQVKVYRDRLSISIPLERLS